jgi:hypothetical protein
MTEDEIAPLVDEILAAAKTDDQMRAVRAATALLTGLLTDINRIAYFLQQIAEKQP